MFVPQVITAVDTALPGAQYRRRLYWRYSLIGAHALLTVAVQKLTNPFF
jgi:hypothetical protein